MTRKLSLLLLIFSLNGFATDTPIDSGDIAVGVQGKPTTVTKHNACVKEKFKVYSPIAGTIPLTAGTVPSSDLICPYDDCGTGIKKGDILTPTEAQRLYEKRFNETRCQWSLADLDPAENKDVWVNKVGSELNQNKNSIKVNDLDTLNFVSMAWGRLGAYRVTVNKDNEYGVPTQYSLFLSKTIHNYILRKSLLEKLGYKIPPVKWVKRVKISFENKNDLENFKKDLSINNAGSFDRWVLNSVNNEIILQDVLLMEDQEFDLNLSKGYISQDMNDGKRIYDSLLVPFALVNVPESINMFSWSVGRTYSGNLVLDYSLASEFNISYHEALWISKRIIKLTEKDWWEIVDSTHLPSSVKILIFEKLKARRNDLARLLDIDNIELPFDVHVNNNEDLVDGEIVQEFYDGYARRFKIPDPESPIDSAKMRSFFKSKAINLGLDAFEKYFNAQGFMGTNISENINEKIEEIIAENVSDTLVSGTTNKVPVSSYIFPTIQGNLIVNRDVVTGPYLGTDNKLQLVDTIGASFSAGAFGGVTGIYTPTGENVVVDGNTVRQKLPVNINAQAKVSISRTYSHVRPILSINQGLKYSFKNLFVPKVMKDNKRVINELITQDFISAFDDDEDKAISNMINHLNENINVGESIIITDSIGGDLTSTVKMNLYEVLDLKLGARPQELVLSRTHIYRASDSEFQVYKSLGNTHSIELSASMEKYIPITKITYKLMKGRARTKFYKLNLGSGIENVRRTENLKALASAFSNGSLNAIERTIEPAIITHKFTESNSKFGIFVWRWNWLDQDDEISIKKPNGNVLNYYRRVDATSGGRDFENYVKDVISAIGGELLDVNFGFRSYSAGNAGNTFYGRATNKIMSYEALKHTDGRLLTPMLKFSRVYNGWKMGKNSVLDLVNDFNKRYNDNLFNDNELAQTEELFLYNVSVSIFIKSRGLDYLAGLDDERISYYWETYTRFTNNKKRERLLNLKKWLIKYKESKNYEKVAEISMEIFGIIESFLNMKGIVQMYGGAKNIFVAGKIGGYREGDEDGDSAIISNSNGRDGSDGFKGPLGTVQSELGMTTGEFSINWLMGRVL